MKDEQFSNIFEAAAKKRPTVPKRPSAAPQSGAASTPSAPAKKPALSNEDVQKMLDHMEKLTQEINEKLQVLYEHSGLSPKNVKLYLEKFGGIDTKEWKKSQQDVKALEEKIWTVLGTQAKATEKAKEQAKAAKARKGKVVGGRQRWIRMD